MRIVGPMVGAWNQSREPALALANFRAEWCGPAVRTDCAGVAWGATEGAAYCGRGATIAGGMRRQGQVRFFLGVILVSFGSAAFSLALRASLSAVARLVRAGSFEPAGLDHLRANLIYRHLPFRAENDP